jgi:hypothetical protein
MTQHMADLDSAVEGLALQLRSMTTAGLLAVLAHVQVRTPLQNQVGELPDKLAFMCDCIVDRVCSRGRVDITLMGGSITVTLENGLMSSVVFDSCEHACMRYFVGRLRRRYRRREDEQFISSLCFPRRIALHTNEAITLCEPLARGGTLVVLGGGPRLSIATSYIDRGGLVVRALLLGIAAEPREEEAHRNFLCVQGGGSCSL